jgi:DNA repair exonuclease SbcCD nuclease subunit
MKNKKPFAFRSNKVCCISDIHIGVHQNSSLWHYIVIDWSRWLRSELKKNKIKDIIICGDLFHYRDEIAVNTIQVTTDILAEWRDFNIIVLVGNHDSYYKDRADVNSLSILKGWSNITVVDRLTQFTAFDRDLLFCPWGTKSEEITKNDIIFGHFEIESFKMNHFKVCTEGIKTSDLLRKTDLVITGHFHHREERKHKAGTILYLGNPYQMDFGDVNTIKGYYLLDIKDKAYTFTENKLSPKHIKVKLSELAARGTIDKEFQQKIKNNIVKFIVDKNIMSDEADFIIQKLVKHSPRTFNVDYAINFNKFSDADTSCDLSGVDVSTAIEEFVDLLEIENKSDIVEYTLDLYKRCK